MSKKLIESLKFEKVGSIPTLPGYSLMTTSVANDQALLFLFVENSGVEPVTERIDHGIGQFLPSRSVTPNRWYLLKVTSSSVQSIELGELDVTFPHIDVFPDGRILVAGPRCSWRGESDYDRNGVVFDPRSGRSTRILLGDGISNVSVDALGRIWVGYLDEGVYGNYGWGGRDGPAPLGSAGLICLSDTGEKVWEYPQNGGYEISDCYALNVSGAEATIFFYTDFPICKVASDFSLQYWKTDLLGCHQLAISETEVLFSGQYREPADVAHLGTLADGRVEQVRKIKLLMPDGSSLRGGKLKGRGKYLYFYDDSDVYRVGLD